MIINATSFAEKISVDPIKPRRYPVFEEYHNNFFIIETESGKFIIYDVFNKYVAKSREECQYMINVEDIDKLKITQTPLGVDILEQYEGLSGMKVINVFMGIIKKNTTTSAPNI